MPSFRSCCDDLCALRAVRHEVREETPIPSSKLETPYPLELARHVELLE